VIVAVLEATRADHLGTYGYRRPTSPHLDRLAADARVYDSAFTTSTDEVAAHGSLLTGLLPSRHGARIDPEGPLSLLDAITAPDAYAVFRARPAREDVATLPEILERNGYDTAAVVAGPWLERRFGFARGFAHYDEDGIDSPRGRDGAAVTDRALAWIGAGRSRPFFLMVQYFDAHAPYEPTLDAARLFLGPELDALPATPDLEQTRALYDAELRHADEQLGRLLDGLRERSLYDTSWIVVTAPYGELLGEHGLLGHGSSLYQEEVRIPLIVKPPKGFGTPGRSHQPALLADVLPIVLEGLGLPVPPSLDGASPEQAIRPVTAELSRLIDPAAKVELRMWVEPPWKLIWSQHGNHALFDLAADPAEARDRSAAEPERLAAMVRRLEADSNRPATAGAGAADSGARRDP
jgi:arylsulfatase A-like enzyme